MVVNKLISHCTNYLAPAPIYLPWLDNQQTEHEAVIEDVLEPGKCWRVRYQASFWKAYAININTQLQPADIVHVVGRQNLTLVIEAL